jgi:hypothetical protein
VQQTGVVPPTLKAAYEHWLAVERSMGPTTNSNHRTLGFLITSSWVLVRVRRPTLPLRRPTGSRSANT